MLNWVYAYSSADERDGNFFPVAKGIGPLAPFEDFAHERF